MIKKILLILCILAIITFIGIVDGGAASGYHPQKMNATVQVVVTLENGHTYVAECYDGEVTVNTHFSEDPTKWEITKY